METVSLQTESANLTEEQFFQLCVQNKELRFEKDKYQTIYIMSPTGGLTSNRNAEVVSMLVFWNKKNKFGYVFDSNAGFNLPNRAMRSPDASWISKERWEALSVDDREKFAHICPDFIIEIRSKSDSLKELQNKMQEWIENGCRLGWLIDFQNQLVYIYKPNCEIRQQNFKEQLSGDDVLPEFVMGLTDIL